MSLKVVARSKAAVMWLLGTSKAVVAWPFRVTKQWLSNVRAAVSEASPDDFVPPWVWETVEWLKMQLPRAAGTGTPYEQMSASVVLAIAMIVVSIGALTPLSAIMVIPLLIGAARLHPVVDRAWPLSTTEGKQPV
jgi:hypothetical protein